jgi:PAS domain S-box-containing protein
MEYNDTQGKIKILLVEDNLNDCELLQRELKKGGLNFLLKVVQTEEAYEYELKNYTPEVILSDLSLPSFDGRSAFLIKESVAPDIPFIVVSGVTEDDKMIELIKNGVTDYVLKEKMYQVVPKIRRALKEAGELVEKRMVYERLKNSEEKYRTLFDMSPFPMWIFDVETFCFLNVNHAAVDQYGYTLEEFLSMTIRDIRPKDDVQKVEEMVKLTKKTGNFSRGVFTHIKKNGQHIHVDIQSNLIELDGRKVRIVLAVDISSRVKYIQEIEVRNKKLQEIAWIQSHIVRAPLARIMGLVKILEESASHGDEFDILDNIKRSAAELDAVIGDIVKKSEDLEA